MRTWLQSYIRPASRASDEAPGLDGFPRASFSISLAASRALVGDKVWKRRSDRFTISVTQRPYATLARAAFSATSVLEYAQSCRPCSLNRGRSARVQSCGRGYPGRAVTVTSGEQRRQHPCILVGQRDRRHIGSALGSDAPRPITACVVLALSECGARTVDQKRSQIAVTTLGNPEQHGLAAR
jgi:hypothetical protein